MKTNKLLLSALALSIATPAIVVPMTTEVEAATYTKSFKDVSKSNVYYDIIHTMAQQGIINGYEDGTFKPSQTINRKQAAALVNRAVKLPKTTAFKAPKDLSTKNAYYADIKALMEAGLLKADSKGNINPNAPLTRGEMAKILTVAFNLEVKAEYDFFDVTSDDSNQTYIQALYSNGVTTGFEDGTFGADKSLTRAHYAVFMYRSYNLDESYKAEPIGVDQLENFDAKEYIKQVMNDSTFDLSDNKSNNIVADALLNKKYIEALLKLDSIVEKHPNFVITSVAGRIMIDKKNYNSPLYDSGRWVGDNIGITFLQTDSNNMNMKFDYMDNETIQLAFEIYNELYPSIANLNFEIEEKIEEAKEGFLNYNPNAENLWDNFTGNGTTINVNDSNIQSVQIGASALLNGFAINVTAD